MSCRWKTVVRSGFLLDGEMRRIDAAPSGLSVSEPFTFPSLRGEPIQFVDVEPLNDDAPGTEEGRHLLLSTKEGVLLEVDGPVKRRFGNAQGIAQCTRIEESPEGTIVCGGTRGGKKRSASGLTVISALTRPEISGPQSR